MKKIYNIFLVSVLAATTVSCSKLLDTKPKDFLSPVNYYQNEAQLNTALAGVYEMLGNNGLYKQCWWNQLGCGNDLEYYRGTTSATVSGAWVFNTSISDASVTEAWNALYTGINRANGLLDAIDASPVDTTKKKIARAQALFLRGYYYFLLVDNWGGVPLRLNATQSVQSADLAKSSVKDVYAQVLADMTAAEAILPTIETWGPSGSGRISRTAAQGILARVCLTMAGEPLKDIAKYNDARTWAFKVIDSKSHALNPDYKQIFINHTKDLYDVKECIWEAEFLYDPAGKFAENSNLGYANSIKCGNLEGGFCTGNQGVTKKLWDLYPDNASLTSRDLRRDWNIGPYGFGTDDLIKTNFTISQIWNRWPAKWRREYEVVLPRSKFFTGTNFPILRYADVLLMFAEAENKINGPTTAAYDAINQVRRRGWGKLLPDATNITAADLPTDPDPGVFHQAIMDERARELCMEALRKRDLVRWGALVPTMKALANDITLNAPSSFKFAALGGNNITARDVLFPIPVSELTFNKAMVQNTGY